MNKLLRTIFFVFLLRPIILLILGLNVRHRQRLPIQGPAIIVANHNSHLDTMVLMTLFPVSLLKSVHPVAAADYFLKSKWLAWFSQKIIGIIPISRQRPTPGENPLANIQQQLDSNNIIIYFPEGSRGEPEKMRELKKGIARLGKDNPQTPIIPIFMHGLGKSLPKNESLLVPFVIDVVIGKAIYGSSDTRQFMRQLNDNFTELKQQLAIKEWL